MTRCKYDSSIVKQIYFLLTEFFRREPLYLKKLDGTRILLHIEPGYRSKETSHLQVLAEKLKFSLSFCLKKFIFK